MATFVEAFELLLQCVSAQNCTTRSGGAVLHKRCPVAAVVAYGCLIDRFCTWPYQCSAFIAAPATLSLRWGSSMAKYCFLRSASSQN